MINTRNAVARAQHILVQQVTHGEILEMIAHGHHSDNFLPIQIQGQRFFHHHPHVNGRAVLVDTAHPLRQAFIVGLGS